MKPRKVATNLWALLFASLLLCSAALAQPAHSEGGVGKILRELQDKAALRELVDDFAVLADKKDVHTQAQLFTPDATVAFIVGGKPTGVLKGREQIEHTFGPYLATFQSLTHFNGQQVVTIVGDKASGITYCTVTLIALQKGKRVRTTMGVHYEDQFVRQAGRWFIAKRTSIFDWQDQQVMSQ